MKKAALALVLTLVLIGCSTSVQVPKSDPSPAERKGAPDFSLENIAGGMTHAQEIKGKVAVIDVWATWCEPCIVEIPRFNQLHDDYQGQPVQVLAITVESEYDTIAPSVKKHNMKYPVLVGNDDVVNALGGVIGFPTTYVLSKDWKIYKKYMGALPNKHDLIKRDIEKLLGEPISATVQKTAETSKRTPQTTAQPLRDTTVQ